MDTEYVIGIDVVSENEGCVTIAKVNSDQSRTIIDSFYGREAITLYKLFMAINKGKVKIFIEKGE